ncbi:MULTISPECIES: L,D-transpeptidase [unclassified Lentimonas]|uniref:L,D-transpeptidase n=1 Tax=unclassified Lentimonas TaxID=2630993 RepID=UPI001389702D|nr:MULTISPECIES: L,D-transpeptidase [unclassified Lentimonas]
MPFDFIKESGRVKQSCEALSITPTHRQIIVSIERQELALISDGVIQRVFSISTSKNPPSCLADSYGTPLGLHALADKIGDGAPLGMVFKGRVPTGQKSSEYSEEEQARNLITTRIIRLRGLETGKNSGQGCDSYDRYVYIHGTNHEDRIGEPFSGGCVEMLNAEVIELFNAVHEGDLVWVR